MREASDARRLNQLAPHNRTRTALIFAGGRATRLGGVNKALLEVGGVRLVDRIMGALNPLVHERIVLSNDDSLSELPGVRVVYDARPHAGVLSALAVGLANASGELCLAVACDMPFVSRQLFQGLVDLAEREAADVIIPRSEGYLEPMHAVYRRAPVLAAIQAALTRGEQRMISYFSQVRVREVEPAEWQTWDADGSAFFNVNTAEDLAAAQLRVS